MGNELQRAIRRWDVVALMVNAVVGAGIFGLPSILYKAAGAWSLLGLVACAVLVALLNLALFELAGRFTATGGPYVYAAAAYGPGAGFLVGWLTWLMRVTAMAAILKLFCDYVGGVAPSLAGGAPHAALAIGAVAALTALNLAGVRTATTASNLFTVGKLVPLAALALGGLAFVAPAHIVPTGGLPVGPVARAAVLCVFAMTGFETATIVAGEMRDPKRDLPFALIASTAAVTVLYGLLLVVAIGTVPDLATSTRPLADAAAQIAGRTGAAIVTAGALISVFGILLALMTAAPRLLFAMAEARELPAALARVHPQRRSPDASVLLTAAAVLALTLTGTFVGIVAVSTTIRLVTYAMTAVAVPVLRRREHRSLWARPAGIPVIAASLALTAWMLTSVRATEALLAVGLAAGGVVLRLVVRAARSSE